MRLTLELDEKQTKVFQDILDTALKAIVYQETVVKEELDNISEAFKQGGTLEADTVHQQFNYLNDYLANITPQRLLLAEILHTVNEAEKKTSIVSADMSDLRKLE